MLISVGKFTEYFRFVDAEIESLLPNVKRLILHGVRSNTRNDSKNGS
jgi:hypothetical protein